MGAMPNQLSHASNRAVPVTLGVLLPGHMTLPGGRCHHSHVTDETAEAQKKSHLPKVIVLLGGRAWMFLQFGPGVHTQGPGLTLWGKLCVCGVTSIKVKLCAGDIENS